MKVGNGVGGIWPARSPGYLLKQYFAMQDGEKPDWQLKGLNEFFEVVTNVNQSFAERVRAASEKDAGVNAIVQLSSRAINTSTSIEERLAEFKSEFLE